MAENTDNHGYATPPAGTENWHEPLNANFEALDIDVELRDVAANRDDYDPKDGSTFLELDTGIIYVGDGGSWTPALAMAFFNEDGEIEAGELSELFDTDPDNRDNGDSDAPNTFGVNAHAVHQGAIVFGDSTTREIWSEQIDELRSQMPIYAPSVEATQSVTTGAVDATSIAAAGASLGSLSATSISGGGLSAEGDLISGEIDSEDTGFEVEADEITFAVDSESPLLTIESDKITSEVDIHAPEIHTTSAQAAKTAIEPVDTAAVLSSVESLSVHTWEFTDGDGRRHMGPMAGDFSAAFGLGDDADSIATVDADGVALAAIKGLADRLRETNERHAATVKELSDRLDELEATNRVLSQRLDGDAETERSPASIRSPSDD